MFAPQRSPDACLCCGPHYVWRGSLGKASRGKRFRRQSARALVRGQSQLAAAFAGRPNGRIAQVVEQLTLNQRVVGSSPTAPTNKIKRLSPATVPKPNPKRLHQRLLRATQSVRGGRKNRPWPLRGWIVAATLCGGVRSECLG